MFNFMNIAIVAVSVIVIGGGLIVLQVYLSKKENKWLGLILPIVFFVIACFIGIGRILYDLQTPFSVLFRDILTFVLYCIPAITFFLIDLGIKNKQSKKHEFERMNVQDL